MYSDESNQLIVYYEFPLIQMLILPQGKIVIRLRMDLGLALGDEETVEEVNIADRLQTVRIDGDVADGQFDLLLRELTHSSQYFHQLLLTYTSTLSPQLTQFIFHFLPIFSQIFGYLV